MARGGRGRGGYRQPSSPAAVSGPGALSARTDGGPGAGSYQYSGLPYGDNQAVNSVAQGAPMPGPGGGGGGGAPAPQGRGGPAVALGPDGVFGATDRPAEPLTAGVDWGAGAGAPPQMLDDDPYLLARALLRVAPSPQLEALVARLARG